MCIISQVQSPEVQNPFHWTKTQAAGVGFCPEALGASVPGLLSGGGSQSLACGCALGSAFLTFPPLTSTHLGNLASPPSSRCPSAHIGEAPPPREVKHLQGWEEHLWEPGLSCPHGWRSPPRGGGHAQGMPPESVARAGCLFFVTGMDRSSVPLTHRKHRTSTACSPWAGVGGGRPRSEPAGAPPAPPKRKPLVNYS